MFAVGIYWLVDVRIPNSSHLIVSASHFSEAAGIGLLVIGAFLVSLGIFGTCSAYREDANLLVIVRDVRQGYLVLEGFFRREQWFFRVPNYNEKDTSIILRSL